LFCWIFNVWRLKLTERDQKWLVASFIAGFVYFSLRKGNMNFTPSCPTFVPENSFAFPVWFKWTDQTICTIYFFIMISLIHFSKYFDDSTNYESVKNCSCSFFRFFLLGKRSIRRTIPFWDAQQIRIYIFSSVGRIKYITFIARGYGQKRGSILRGMYFLGNEKKGGEKMEKQKGGKERGKSYGECVATRRNTLRF